MKLNHLFFFYFYFSITCYGEVLKYGVGDNSILLDTSLPGELISTIPMLTTTNDFKLDVIRIASMLDKTTTLRLCPKDTSDLELMLNIIYTAKILKNRVGEATVRYLQIVVDKDEDNDINLLKMSYEQLLDKYQAIIYSPFTDTTFVENSLSVDIINLFEDMSLYIVGSTTPVCTIPPTVEYIPNEALEREANKIVFEYFSVANAQLIRIAVADVEIEYLDAMKISNNIDNDHIIYFDIAKQKLLRYLSGAPYNIIDLAQNELYARVTNYINAQSLNKMVATMTACDSLIKEDEISFSATISKKDDNLKPHELAALATEAVLEHAEKSVALGCTNDYYDSKIYAKVNERMIDRELRARDALEHAADRLFKQYKNTIEQITNSDPPYNHEDLSKRNADTINSLLAEFENTFTNYGRSDDTMNKKTEFLIKIEKKWKLVSERNNNTVTYTCSKIADDETRRYANQIFINCNEMGENEEINETYKELLKTAEEKYKVRAKRYMESNIACRSYLYKIPLDIRELVASRLTSENMEITEKELFFNIKTSFIQICYSIYNGYITFFMYAEERLITLGIGGVLFLMIYFIIKRVA